MKSRQFENEVEPYILMITVDKQKYIWNSLGGGGCKSKDDMMTRGWGPKMT